MNNEINSGGPAFPISLPGYGDNGASGMTLRDYFAAHLSDESEGSDYGDAIKAALVGRECPSLRSDGPIAVLQFEAEFRAKWRLMRADEMLAARETKS